MSAECILIVEDEPLVAMEMKETLEAAGFRVPTTVDSADKLFSAVREHSPALILMDVRLHSFLDGIDAVARLRFLTTIPVVYVTAYSTPEIVRRAEGTHPAAFLVKPVDGDKLIKTVRQVLNQESKEV